MRIETVPGILSDKRQEKRKSSRRRRLEYSVSEIIGCMRWKKLKKVNLCDWQAKAKSEVIRNDRNKFRALGAAEVKQAYCGFSIIDAADSWLVKYNCNVFDTYEKFVKANSWNKMGYDRSSVKWWWSNLDLGLFHLKNCEWVGWNFFWPGHHSYFVLSLSKRKTKNSSLFWVVVPDAFKFSLPGRIVSIAHWPSWFS